MRIGMMVEDRLALGYLVGTPIAFVSAGAQTSQGEDRALLCGHHHSSDPLLHGRS